MLLHHEGPTPGAAATMPWSSCRKTIAVVQGASGFHVQRLFQDFVERWRPTHRLVGVIEEPDDDMPDHPARSHLRIITDGCRYPLFQDLGRNSTSCGLYAGGAVLACETVTREISAGCDVAVISKFGRLEAESRSGLMAAFIAAVEAGVPVLTSVAPKFDGAWQRFAAPLFVTLPAETAAVEAWWLANRRRD